MWLSELISMRTETVLYLKITKLTPIVRFPNRTDRLDPVNLVLGA